MFVFFYIINTKFYIPTYSPVRSQKTKKNLVELKLILFSIQHIYSNPLKYKSLSNPFFTMKCRICYSNAHTPHTWNDVYTMADTSHLSISCLILSLIWLVNPKWLHADAFSVQNPGDWLRVEQQVSWCRIPAQIRISSRLALSWQTTNSSQCHTEVHTSANMVHKNITDRKHSLRNRGNNNIPV